MGLPESRMSDTTDPKIPSMGAIIAKLQLGLGEKKAKRVVAECLREAHLIEISTCDELQLLAERLIARGGFVCIVGRSLMVDIIMMRRSAQSS